MLDVYTVAFFGHRYIDNPAEVEKRLEKIIRELIDKNGFVEFLVGRNGEFDVLAAGVIHRLRKHYRDDNSAAILVLPYMTAEYKNNADGLEEFFTDVEISLKAANSPPKAAIQIRNREMVDRASLIVCYIKEKGGGAWQTVEYARKNNRKIINIA